MFPSTLRVEGLAASFRARRAPPAGRRLPGARELGLGAEASALSGPGGRKRALDRLFQQAIIPLPSLVRFGATCSSGHIQGLVHCQPWPAVDTEFVPCICGLRGTFVKYNSSFYTRELRPGLGWVHLSQEHGCAGPEPGPSQYCLEGRSGCPLSYQACLSIYIYLSIYLSVLVTYYFIVLFLGERGNKKSSLAGTLCSSYLV